MRFPARPTGWALPLVLALGCAPDLPQPEQPDPWESVGTEDGGHSDLTPEPPAPEPASRPRRRLDIDQLDASIRAATGGISWGEGEGDSRVEFFEDLAGTLGKPDYLDRTAEDLSPSTLFVKFLDEAATAVCEELVEAERARPAGERVLIPLVEPTTDLASDRAAIEENLRYLVGRYHSRQIAAGDPALNPWTWLFETSAHLGGEPMLGWRAVCIGLITHPDFYSY